MIGYWLLILHLIGDYTLQSDWMASEKVKVRGWWPAVVHALTYALPFALLFGFQWEPLVLIGVTHFIIDHWRLARYVCWAKNFLSPSTSVTMMQDTEGLWYQSTAEGVRTVERRTVGDPLGDEDPEAPSFRVQKEVPKWRHPWKGCSKTGYSEDKPVWLTTWLLFIVDNTMHLAINGLAWELWGSI